VTLLAKNLKISNIDLPEKEKRRDSDMEVPSKLRDLLGNSIKVKLMPNSGVHFTTKDSVIILEP